MRGKVTPMNAPCEVFCVDFFVPKLWYKKRMLPQVLNLWAFGEQRVFLEKGVFQSQRVLHTSCGSECRKKVAGHVSSEKWEKVQEGSQVGHVQSWSLTDIVEALNNASTFISFEVCPNPCSSLLHMVMQLYIPLSFYVDILLHVIT